MSDKNVQRSEHFRLLQRAVLVLCRNYYVSMDVFSEPLSITVLMQHRSVTEQEVLDMASKDPELKGKLKGSIVEHARIGTQAVKLVVDEFRNHVVEKKGRK